MKLDYSKWIKDSALVIMDYETTGLVPGKALPIEVGMIIMSFEDPYNALSYESLIKHDSFMNHKDWPDNMQRAFQVHKIPLDEVKKNGKKPKCVVKDINDTLDFFKQNFNSDIKRFIITSDNAQFEYNFTNHLYMDAGYKYNDMPFHYCAWDTSLMFNIYGDAQDPRPVHRAMGDTQLLYAEILKCIKAQNER